MAQLDIALKVVDQSKRGLDSFGRNLDDAGRKTSKLGGLAKGAALGVAGIAVAGVAIGTKLVGDLLATGDALHKMSGRTGIGIETLQEMQFAAEQSGSSLETFEKAILRQARFITEAANGTKSNTEALAELGITLGDLEGKHPDEQFKVLADAIAGVEDPTKRAALAQEVFGRSGAELIPLLNEGSAGIEELTRQARENGDIMSTKAATAAAKFNDGLNILKHAGMSAVVAGFEVIIPLMVRLVEWINQHIVPALRTYLSPALKAIGDYLADPLFPAFRKLIGIYLTPLKLLIRGLATVVRQVMIPAFQRIVPVVQAMWGAISPVLSGIRTAAEGAASAIRAIADAASAVSGVAGAVGGIVGKLPGFASGGIVPGRPGSPMLAVVHGGERITPRGATSGGGFDGPLHVTLELDGEQLRTFVIDTSRRAQRAGAL